jgi:hypothetical protein
MTLVDKTPRIFVCGDSFCVRDPEYGPAWIDYLCNALPDADVITLSSPAASNYLIYLQTQHALTNGADYIIYHATSSIRQEFLLRPDDSERDHYQRYWNIADPQQNPSMACTSWLNPDKTTVGVLSKSDSHKIKNFFCQHLDLTSVIEKNHIFIKHTLAMLESAPNLKNWAWSRGGFEHRTFAQHQFWDFSQYQSRECHINLWDKFEPGHRLERPFYHIVDHDVKRDVAEEYINLLKLA